VHVGIDGSNLRSGGGVTHIVQLLAAAEPARQGIDAVTTWVPGATGSLIGDREWLRKPFQPALDGSLAQRLAWRSRHLPRLARECDVLFVPGGGYSGRVRPYVTMFRNMLPFERRERQRYGMSWMRLRLRLLRHAQVASFRDADGVVFLNEHARDLVIRHMGPLPGLTAVIPHGVDTAFRRRPRLQRQIGCYDADRPFRLLYVSIVDLYKHQERLAEAVATLRARGRPVSLDLAGPAYGPALARLRHVLQRLDARGTWLRYIGNVSFAGLPDLYASADAFVFPSTCENMPNVLLEAMASGLPIACSSYAPMPQVLGEAGLYFDPLMPASMADAIDRLLQDADLRARLAEHAWHRAQQFSWRQCADETFAFLARVVQSRARRVR
jgi:glycosyltransferase involved in cell wall biosynthesis